MPRPRKPEEEKVQSITVSLPGWLYRWLKEQEKPSKTVETSLLLLLEKMEKKD